MPREGGRSRLPVEGASVELTGPKMCNDYEQRVRWAEYRKMMQPLELAIPTHQSESDLPQADDVRISESEGEAPLRLARFVNHGNCRHLRAISRRRRLRC
jgi:hypothetical protein